MTSNKSTSKLTSKIYPALKAIIFVAGAATLQACFFGGGHRFLEPGLTLWTAYTGRGPDMRTGGPPHMIYGRPPETR